MSEKKATQKSASKTTARKTAATSKASAGFTAEERAAAKERVQELRVEARHGADATAGESEVLKKIAEMQGTDRDMAERLHTIIKANAPDLLPKTWYGMPAYAKGGKVVCFFQPAAKFNYRYATLGFQDPANLDEGAMWPVAFALTKLTAADEKKIAALVEKAVS